MGEYVVIEKINKIKDKELLGHGKKMYQLQKPCCENDTKHIRIHSMIQFLAHSRK